MSRTVFNEAQLELLSVMASVKEIVLDTNCLIQMISIKRLEEFMRDLKV